MRNILMLLIFFASACQHSQPNKKIFDFYPNIPDSSQEKFLSSEIKKARFFNLPLLYKGVDSFEIRIRPWDVFDRGINLFVLRVDSVGWKGYHYDSYTLFHKKQDGTRITKKDSQHIGDSVFLVKEFNPLCGWKNFIDSIKSFKLESLPTQDSIKFFTPVRGVVDGSGYNIEIATPHSYRILSYFLPENSPFTECKTISNFMVFFQRQLGKEYDWPDNLQQRDK